MDGKVGARRRCVVFRRLPLPGYLPMTIAAAVLYALASTATATAPLAAPVQEVQVPQSQPPSTADVQDPDVQEDIPTGSAAVSAEGDPDAYDLGEVTVTSARPRGSVESDIQPDVVLDAEQIRAYGASNIAELLTALEPLTRSSRGRSDAGPVLLLNGRRISGFQEIQGIPTEAIERTDILPEEVALSYGYSADQRVVNFVLKPAFRQGTASVQTRGPTQGGRSSSEVEGGFFTIRNGDRFNLDVEHQRDTALFESERDIARSPGGQPFDRIGNVTGIDGEEIDPALSALAGSAVTVAAVPTGAPTLAGFAAGAGAPRTDDLTAWRTLLPKGEQSTVRGSFSRDLNETTKGTVSISLEDTSSQSFLGLPGLTLTLPGANPYSPFTNDALLYRYIDAPEVMTRDTDALNGKAAALLDGYLGEWRYSVTGTYDRAESESTTGRGFNAAAIQTRLNAGDPTLNPFGDLPREQLTALTDTSRSVTSGGNLEGVLNGSLWEGPAGKLQSTIKFGLDTRSLESESRRSGVFAESELSRDRAYGSASLTVPIASRSREVLAGLGDLSLNFNAGYDEVSDFGGLTAVGLGANWAPREQISFVVSYNDEHGAPTIQQLNDPVVSTPNTPVFDFRTGQTVNVTRIDGGNPDLTSDNRQVAKIGVNLRPFSARDLSFSSNYTWSRTDDAITAFPTITPDLEAALPERFVRDAAGNLISFDARALNYTRAERQDLRTGFNYSRAFGKPTPGAAGRPGARPGGPGGGGMMIMSGAGGPPPGGGGGGGMRFGGGPGGRGGGMQPGQGRFNLSIYHTYRFQDEIVIRDGLPVLDQLNGAATSARGGTPKQEVQVQAGVFRNGFGGFMNANWREGTFVDGGTSGSDLFFSGQTTVNLNLFADLSSRAGLIAKAPWLKGSRINLGVENLFDTRLEVSSASGTLPLNYQPDFLDPQGRVVRISFRKILF